jgi:5-methylthioadenosine/S-adenosylhomocysteine deaminase
LGTPTILLPRYLLPVRPRGEVLTDHAVVIEGDEIAAIEPSGTALERYPHANQVKLSSHVLLPGLFNMHTHSAMSLLRGYADDLALDTWLNEYIWPAEQRWLSADFVRDGTELAIAEMIRSGTTFFNEMYFFPDVIAETVTRTGLRGCVGLPIINVESAWGSDYEEYLRKALDLHENQDFGDRVMTSLAPHAMYTVTDDLLVKIAEISERDEVPVHIHLLEVAGEVKHSIAEYGVRPLERLQALGLLNSRLIAVHMAHLTDSEIEMLARVGVNVVHCPESNLKLASGMCPLASLIEGGVNVSVGTDGAASNNDLDILGELRRGGRSLRGRRRHRD